MNYIKQLEQERAELQNTIIEREQRSIEFKDHLLLSKFDHPNNYINVEDVRRWLRYVETGRN
jgi:hypothetical protein